MNRKYTWNAGKLKRAYMEGVTCDADGVIRTTDADRHLIILDRVNSYEENSGWGRLKLDMEIPANCTFSLLAFAADADAPDHSDIGELTQFFRDSARSADDKKDRIKSKDHVKFVGRKDVLLYALKGQYLWICLEIFGESPCEIRAIELSQGDNFMQTFPEIYQDEGGFFHRYLSVFSSIYNDINDEFDTIDSCFDPDTAPVSLLPVFAEWLGLELGKEMFDEKILRRLVKNAYRLNKMKGTRKAVELLTELVTGTKAIVMGGGSALQGAPEKGPHANADDVVIIVNQPPDEGLHAQLTYLIGQFIPVCCNIVIRFIPQCSRLDAFGCIGHNAALAQIKDAVLDDGSKLDGTVGLDRF